MFLDITDDEHLNYEVDVGCFTQPKHVALYSSSSIATATLVGFGLLNYR